MNPILKNVLAVIAGVVVGSAVNMAIIMISGSVIPLPEGVDASNAESLKSNIHLFETKHYIMPFLAHALGTLVGAFVAAKIAANNKMKFSLAIGVFFIIGGILNAKMIGSPLVPTLVDIILAYIPFAWFGGKLANA